MARGDFLNDLSGGIFTRLRELRQEQETKDSDQKKQTLSLLASLADKVEPDSLPTLLGHMGDVIGMKGDLRKFWDAFSGMPDRSVADKLGTLTKDIYGKMVGPETARTARQTNLEELIQPYRQQGTRPRQVANLPGPSQLEGKMVLRDPLKEKVSEIEARYATQAQAQMERQSMMNQFRAAQQEDRQRNEKDIAEYKANLRAEADINEEARRITRQRGFAEPTSMIWQEAARNVGKRQGWTDEKLRATTDYLRAKTDESRTMSDAMKKSGGLTPSQEVNTEDRRREAARSLKTAFDKSMGRRAEAQKIMSDTMAAIQVKLDTIRGKVDAEFDPATGTIVPKGGDKKAARIFEVQALGFPELLQTYKKAAAELKGAETEAKGYWGNLRTAPYNKYYTPGKDFTEPVSESMESIGTTTPTAPTPPASVQGTTLPLSKGGAGTIRIPPREGIVLNVGQFVNYAGKPHIVTSIEPDGTAVLTPRKR